MAADMSSIAELRRSAAEMRHKAMELLREADGLDARVDTLLASAGTPESHKHSEAPDGATVGREQLDVSKFGV